MADMNISELLTDYQRWEQLIQEQIICLQQELSEESFAQLRELELEKRSVMSKVMGQELMTEQFNPSVIEQCSDWTKRLLSANEQLEQGIQVWYGQAEQEMKQLTSQRRILNSYAGMQNSDIISYYFDEKK